MYAIRFNGCLRIQWPTGRHIFLIYGDLGVQSKRHITTLLVWRLTAGAKRPGALLHHPNAPSLHSTMITTKEGCLERGHRRLPQVVDHG